ncbi:hypothetical protein KO507_13055 [Gilvimarinus agarilyticus]|uniref:hypothetical protein n=1 Tax=unclassified Gilvimarinus TaxID=2642066 RepID=UPI001C0A45C3|nr:MULTISPECIES: hypothetical protein [unclassified Gilvimarinus]MBU2886695.1 hypothetical protein [Gilvimarinus agarilyticus]MDO6571362.1 hypothetical protein [Gilvimarinus sp. 2_MG-2023]MDO6746221.1 hypothetical protein [Gilvimarinus sp. 1_MG-2023]
MNIDWISAASNVIMTVIWFIYLQFFYFNFRRSNRPYMIIHQAHSNGPSSPCMFVNMSKEPVHIQSIVAYIETENGVRRRFITDYQRHSPEDKHVEDTLREGPLQPGGYVVLGSFKEILRGDKSESTEEALVPGAIEKSRNIEICIAVTHGPSQNLIGVRRSFSIREGNNNASLQPRNIYTEQMTSRKKRKEVRQWVQDRFKPEKDSESEDQSSEQTLN